MKANEFGPKPQSKKDVMKALDKQIPAERKSNKKLETASPRVTPTYPATASQIVKRAAESFEKTGEHDPRRELHGKKLFLAGWESKRQGLRVDTSRRIAVLLCVPNLDECEKGVNSGLDAHALGFVAVYWQFDPRSEEFTGGPDYLTPSEIAQLQSALAPAKTVAKLATAKTQKDAQA